MPAKHDENIILDVKDLSIGFKNDAGGITAITDKVSFQLKKGEILGLAGESGCGKTITALALLRLLPIPEGQILSGSIRYKGRDLMELDTEQIRNLRGNDISMIFQEPSSALNPLMKVEAQLLELFEYHDFEGNPDSLIRQFLKRTGFADPDRILNAYPHELSGGMLQRVMIALALLLKPDIILADEPTTALDVTVQAQIMELLQELQREEGSSVILITHNLGLVAQYADRVAIMYAGRIAEMCPVDEFLQNPQHPYSKGLIDALPYTRLDSTKNRLKPIRGQVPRPENFPEGCRFMARCDDQMEICKQKPGDYNVSKTQPHLVSCFLYQDFDTKENQTNP